MSSSVLNVGMALNSGSEPVFSRNTIGIGRAANAAAWAFIAGAATMTAGIVCCTCAAIACGPASAFSVATAPWSFHTAMHSAWKAGLLGSMATTRSPAPKPAAFSAFTFSSASVSTRSPVHHSPSYQSMFLALDQFRAIISSILIFSIVDFPFTPKIRFQDAHRAPRPHRSE